MKIAYLFTTFPTLSQTFLQREIRGVAATGITIDIHSMWTPKETPAWESTPGVTLYRWRKWELFSKPWKSAFEFLHHLPLFCKVIGLLFKYPFRSREDIANALLATLFALRRAAEFRAGQYDLIHGAWASAPASAAWILSHLCGIPFSFGAHAYDIHRNGGDRFLRPKLERATLVHTTTQMNVDYLTSLCPTAKIVLSRRGLPSLPPLQPKRAIEGPVRILSVGRLIPKKGHHAQLEAIDLLKKAGIRCTLKIIGDGPLRAELEKEIETQHLQREIELLGARSESEVIEAYAWADLFWHSGIVDREGDRDGLPNVIPEAMAHGVPVISSDAAGTTEAVLHERTGLIAFEGTAENLAHAVQRLLKEDSLRERMRAAAHGWVAENFLVETNARRLTEAFKNAILILIASKMLLP